jgi:HEAT repeat protein
MNSNFLRKNKNLLSNTLVKLKNILKKPIILKKTPEVECNTLLHPTIKELLPDENPEEKKCVSKYYDVILMTNNDFNELVKSLLYDSMPYVRKNAAISLGELGDKRAIEYLTRSLGDENIEVRMSAARSLVQLKDEAFIDKLIEALKDSNKYLREQTAQVLVSIGEKAVNPLINTFKSDNWMLPYISVTILGRIGNTEAIKALIDLLDDEGNIYVQKASVEAIERIGIQAETELLKAFDNKYVYVKEKILNILSKTGGEKTIEKLNKSIEQEADKRLKKYMEECVKSIQEFKFRKN